VAARATVTWASVQDVKDRWPPTGPPYPADPVLEQWLDDAELVIRARYIEIDWYLDELEPTFGDIPAATVALVQSRLVTRALTQPGERAVIRESIGDASVTYEPGGEGGGLTLNTGDLELLDRWFQPEGHWGAA
jgi:hypothetical protein